MRQERTRLVIAKGLDRARSLPTFGTNDNSVVGGSSDTSGDGASSSDVGLSSS